MSDEFKINADLSATEIARLAPDGVTLTVHLDRMPGGAVFIDYPVKGALWRIPAPMAVDAPEQPQ